MSHNEGLPLTGVQRISLGLCLGAPDRQLGPQEDGGWHPWAHPGECRELSPDPECQRSLMVHWPELTTWAQPTGRGREKHTNPSCCSGKGKH